MRIIGSGSLAQDLNAQLGSRHPDVTAIAAGVSSTWVTDPAAFDREARLLYDVLQECRREHRRVLFFSTASSAMYGSSTIGLAEDAPVQPSSVYGRHKLALESVLRTSGVEHLILRLSHLVGSHHPDHHLLPAMVRQIGEGSVTIHRGAHRDLLDVDDLITAIDGLLDLGLPGPGEPRVINVASGLPQPIERIVGRLETLLGAHPERIELIVPGAVTRVEIGRLRSLVPAFSPGIDADAYLNRVLERYLPFYAPTPADS